MASLLQSSCRKLGRCLITNKLLTWAPKVQSSFYISTSFQNYHEKHLFHGAYNGCLNIFLAIPLSSSPARRRELICGQLQLYRAQVATCIRKLIPSKTLTPILTQMRVSLISSSLSVQPISLFLYSNNHLPLISSRAVITSSSNI